MAKSFFPLLVCSVLTTIVYSQTQQPVVSDMKSQEVLRLLGAERWDDALFISDSLIKAKPDFIPYRHDRAVALFNLQRYRDAIADYEVLHHYFPDEAEYVFQIGNSYEHLSDPGQAIRYYTNAIGINDSSYLYFFKRGTVYLKQGSFKEAERDFTASLNLNPYHHNSFHNRGIARFKLNRKTEGCADWCAADELGNTISMSHIDKLCKPCGEKK